MNSQIPAAVAQSADVISILTPDWKFTYVSEAGRALLGFEPEELLGKSFYELVHPDDASVIAASNHFVRHPAGLKDKLTIHRLMDRVGNPVWVESVSRPITDSETGEIAYIVTSIRDISRRSDIDDFLKQSLSWRNAILNSANQAIVVTNLDGVITLMNPCAETLTGYTATELVGRERPEAFLDPKAAASHSNQGPGHGSELSLFRKDGASVPVHLSRTPIRNSAGEIKGYLYSLRDMSVEKQSQVDLYVSEARFRAVVEASPDAFLLLRAVRAGESREITDFVVEDVNTRAVRTMNRDRSQLLGKQLPPEVSLEKDSPLFHWLRDAVESCEVFETEFLTTHDPENGRWFRIQGVPIQDGIALFLRDNTSKKRAEEIIREQNRAMLNASKLSALGEMAAGIAHEINNPIAVIESLADQLETLAHAGILDRSSVLHAADKIHATVGRVGRIIRNLRSFARDGQNDPLERGSLGKIVGETLEFCQERIRNHSIELRVSDFGPDCEVLCRPTQLSQVLLNLLNNSFDAILGLEDRWISISFAETPNRFVLSVADSGAGIPAELVDKLMQPFFTTKELGKGTGLGLSIARGIIEAHGGRLYLDTDQARTTFVIELPKITPAELASEAVAA